MKPSARMLTRLKTRFSEAPAATAGQHFEHYARDYLLARGLQLIECNFRCPLGEIDLIMLDGDSLVFIEVKYRKCSRHGESIEQITHRKRQKLINSALWYLSRHRRYADMPCRLDVVGIAPGQSAPVVTWIRNALEMQ